MEKIELNTRTEQIQRFLESIFHGVDNILDRTTVFYPCSPEYAFCFYDAKTKIFRIGGDMYRYFDSLFSEYYYYEKDFRNIIKEYVQTRYNIEIKTVWIGC